MVDANPPEEIRRTAAGAGSPERAPAAAPCPLCQARARFFHSDRRRPYYRCPTCDLVHVPCAWQLDAAAEKAQYDLHDNRPDDPGYRRFLSRAGDAVRHRVAPPADGLDFGCGPGPTLSLMLCEAGYHMALYDPFYAPRAQALNNRYDFITATEVFEHLRTPAAGIARLRGALRDGGWLIVMTKRPREDRIAFARWHYIHDPTHVAFFSAATFVWVADHYDFDLEIVGDDVVALRRRPTA